MARCDRLEPQARAVLDAVAIFPRRAERGWALQAAGTSEEAIDACMTAGLLEDSGDYLSFRHEIARQAVETSLGMGQRRRLNAAVLASLQGEVGVPTARLLHHARGAGDRAAMARLTPLAVGGQDSSSAFDIRLSADAQGDMRRSW